MQHTSYMSNIYLGFAGTGHREVPLKMPDEVGIVLTLPLEKVVRPETRVRQINGLRGFRSNLPHIYNQGMPAGACVKSLEIDDLVFMYAQTYFDRVVFAVPCDAFGQVQMKPTELQNKFYSLESWNLMPIFYEGAISSLSVHSKGIDMDPDAYKAFQRGCVKDLTALLSRDGPNWQMGNNVYGLQLDQSKSRGGILLELHDKLPIVMDISDPADFLRWKEDRKEQRVALIAAINDFVGCLDKVDDATLQKKLTEVEVHCHELVRVSQERFPRVVLRPVSFSFNYDFARKTRTHGAVAGGLLGLLLGVEKEGSLIRAGIGHALGVRLKDGPSFAKSVIKDSPFASVVDLQYGT